jgi:hypothetical protein
MQQSLCYCGASIDLKDCRHYSLTDYWCRGQAPRRTWSGSGEDSRAVIERSYTR